VCVSAYLSFTGVRSARTTILKVYEYVCVDVFVGVCCGVFVRARVCASTGGRLRKSECVCVCVCEHLAFCVCMCVHNQTQVAEERMRCVRTDVKLCIRMCVCIYTRIYRCVCMYTYTYICVCISCVYICICITQCI